MSERHFSLNLQLTLRAFSDDEMFMIGLRSHLEEDDHDSTELLEGVEEEDIIEFLRDKIFANPECLIDDGCGVMAAVSTAQVTSANTPRDVQS